MKKTKNTVFWMKTKRGVLFMALLVMCLGKISYLSGQNSNCIDLMDLNAPYIYGTYGNYANPYLNQGIVEGRHTVITDPSATDPRTSDQLRMIPPGESYSIKLGNENTGAEAESISIDISIDTSQFDYLILKYAVVMQNPSHPLSEQPRFMFDILDMQNQPIDTCCLSEDFTANLDLGWNNINTLLWKDWTTVGVDISGFHNQTIRVRLTTYDCTPGAHFGYAYFLLTCGRKTIGEVSCGDTERSFSAPSGFNYKWYWQNDPSNIISTTQTVSVPANAYGVLLCQMSFIGNDSCSFEMPVILDMVNGYPTTYPVAVFDIEPTDCPQKKSFLNESFVSDDGSTPNGTGDHCEDVFWDFGDGQTSNLSSPTHQYTAPGDYTVMMVAGLNGFRCTDTVYQTVHISEDTRVDTLVCDAFEWNNTVYTESGVYLHNYATSGDCDSLVVVHLTVVKSDVIETDTMACDHYVWNDSVYFFPGTYSQTFPRVDRCDSIVITHLSMDYTPEFDVVGPNCIIGGSEWGFTEYTYAVALDNPLCRIDTVEWSIDCPNMSVQPIGDGTKTRLRVFTFLAPNDSVALYATTRNCCGAVEKTFWIRTTYYDIGEHADSSPDLTIYPNPNTGWFTLEMRGFPGHAAITVYDTEGLEVMAWEESHLPDEVALQVDCSHLRDGVYTFRIHNATATLSKKVVIRR